MFVLSAVVLCVATHVAYGTIMSFLAIHVCTMFTYMHMYYVAMYVEVPNIRSVPCRLAVQDWYICMCQNTQKTEMIATVHKGMLAVGKSHLLV